MKYTKKESDLSPLKYTRTEYRASSHTAMEIPCPLPGNKYGVKKRGRKPLWTPRAITQEDISRGWAFVRKWGPKIATRDRVRRDYEIVLGLSNRNSSTEAIVGTLGQMLPVLSAGSCENYVRFITTRWHHTDNQRILKACEAAHADADTTHAADISEEDLWRTFCRAPPQHRLIFYLLWASGLRTIAISRLRGKQISASECGLEIEVRIDKNRKKRALRTLLSVPWEWIGGHPPQDILDAIQGLGDDALPFEHYTASGLNEILKKTMISGIVEKCTTYSFRRAFVNMVIARCEGAKHAITSFTLHLRPTMVDAHYRVWKKARDLLEKRRSDIEKIC